MTWKIIAAHPTNTNHPAAPLYLPAFSYSPPRSLAISSTSLIADTATAAAINTPILVTCRWNNKHKATNM